MKLSEKSSGGNTANALEHPAKVVKGVAEIIRKLYDRDPPVKVCFHIGDALFNILLVTHTLTVRVVSIVEIKFGCISVFAKLYSFRPFYLRINR